MKTNAVKALIPGTVGVAAFLATGRARLAWSDSAQPEGFLKLEQRLTEDLRWKSLLRADQVDCFLVEHQLSRMNRHRLLDFLLACREVLRPGGRLRIGEPDFWHTSPAYLAQVARHATTQFNLHTLCDVLFSVGLAACPLEYHDAAGTLHCHPMDVIRHGRIGRSFRFDPRARDPEFRFSSLIMDAIKPDEASVGVNGFEEKIYAIGDSHTRFLAGKDDLEGGVDGPHFRYYEGFAARFNGMHLGPCLAYSLDKPNSTFKVVEKMNAIFTKDLVPKGARLMFVFGEIDCRSHVIRQSEQQGRPVMEIVRDICDIYVAFLDSVAQAGYRVMVWGPVASTPNQNYADERMPAYGTVAQRNEAILLFNDIMQSHARPGRFEFVSITRQLIGPNGETRAEYYCDDIHLSQKARRFLWDLMPD